MDRLIAAAIHTVTPRSIVLQLDQLRGALPTRSADPALAFVLPDVNRELATLAPLSAQLEESDLTISWYMYHIKALVALLNEDINQYVTRVAEASEQRAAQGAALHQYVYSAFRAAGAGDHRLRRVVHLP